MYQIEVLDAKDSKVFEVSKHIEPFLKESRLIKAKYILSPKQFVLRSDEDIQEDHIRKQLTIQPKQWQGFIKYVENPQVYSEIKSLEAEIDKIQREIEKEKVELETQFSTQEKEYNERVGIEQH